MKSCVIDRISPTKFLIADIKYNGCKYSGSTRILEVKETTIDALNQGFLKSIGLVAIDDRSARATKFKVKLQSINPNYYTLFNMNTRQYSRHKYQTLTLFMIGFQDRIFFVLDHKGNVQTISFDDMSTSFRHLNNIYLKNSALDYRQYDILDNANCRILVTASQTGDIESFNILSQSITSNCTNSHYLSEIYSGKKTAMQFTVKDTLLIEGHSEFSMTRYSCIIQWMNTGDINTIPRFAFDKLPIYLYNILYKSSDLIISVVNVEFNFNGIYKYLILYLYEIIATNKIIIRAYSKLAQYTEPELLLQLKKANDEFKIKNALKYLYSDLGLFALDNQ